MFLYKKEIDSSIAFYDPAIDIYSYSSIRNLKMDPIYNFIIADFMTPVSKTTPKDDHTDHYQLSFLFTPRLTGTQDITIFFHDIEDPKYQKHSFSLHFED